MSWSPLLRALVVLCLFPSASVAGEDPVNVLGSGTAIQGYDPVAYFVDGEPRKGQPELSVTYSGARWLFSSKANMRLFLENPDRYFPAYGGYCAYDVAQGHLSGVDPQAWTILYDRLYLNCPEPVHDLWLSDAPSYIKQANENWLRVAGHLATQQPSRRTKHTE